tara:strand:- start:127 stop:399 length:273 start_codon:yes stop_codon:yes gene_type:complete
MTQQQLIETVKQHHPQLTNAQIRIFLNTALKEFTRKSRILTNQTTFTTTSGQRYYPIVNIDSRIHEISKVEYDGYEIPRLVGEPEKSDVD